VLRSGVGLIGMLLPLILLVGNSLFAHELVIRGSVSSYYYTPMRDVFVGGLCSMGVFLLAYRYEPIDDRASTVAGLAAIGVALFPTAPDGVPDGWVGRLHLGFAAVFFLTLAFFCAFLFTRSSSPADQLGAAKRHRNLLYRVCGWLIVVSLLVAVLTSRLAPGVQQALHPLYWCEFVASLAFGVAWAVKGETIGSRRVRERPAPDAPRA
jgi:uncharacterized membrane protein